MTAASSGIYAGVVTHERLKPRRHRLRYRVFSLLMDLDDLETLSGKYRLLGYNHAALFSVHDADHGDGKGIRNWVEEKLHGAGLADAGAKILMLCYPRVLGYVFNPLTVFFCYRQNGGLGAIVYEVHNTFGGRHGYALGVPERANPGEVIRQSCAKQFFVSPFIPMDCTYDFRVHAPDERVHVAINEKDLDGPLLTAVFSGRYRSLTDAALLQMAIRYPLMTLKVIAGIHFEALRLFLKGVPYLKHVPAEPRLTSEPAATSIQSSAPLASTNRQVGK